MNPASRSQSLGKPALEIAGFALWVHGDEFPDGTDENEANGLRVATHRGGAGADVGVSGPILRVPELKRLGEERQALRDGRLDTAEFSPMEPKVALEIQALDTLGHGSVPVKITPDLVAQDHSFVFEIDPTHLPEISKRCQAIALEVPIRGKRGQWGT